MIRISNLVNGVVDTSTETGRSRKKLRISNRTRIKQILKIWDLAVRGSLIGIVDANQIDTTQHHWRFREFGIDSGKNTIMVAGSYNCIKLLTFDILLFRTFFVHLHFVLDKGIFYLHFKLHLQKIIHVQK